MDNLIIFGVIAVIVLASVSTIVSRKKRKSSCCGSADYRAKPRKLKKVVCRKTFLVEGMHCQHCVNRVMEVVQDLPGLSASVNLRRGNVTVSMEETVPDHLIIEAIEKAGYQVTVV